MDLKGIMLNEISQTEKGKCHLITYMWNLKNKTNEQIKQNKTHRYREQIGGYQRRGV